jgi:hypothetical protein
MQPKNNKTTTPKSLNKTVKLNTKTNNLKMFFSKAHLYKRYPCAWWLG